MKIKSKELEQARKHSKFSIASLLIGFFNIVILLYYIRSFAMWLMMNPEISNNPSAINGMPVPAVVMRIIFIFIIVQFVGLSCGFVGLTRSNKKKWLAILGTALNGMLFLITLWKIT